MIAIGIYDLTSMRHPSSTTSSPPLPSIDADVASFFNRRRRLRLPLPSKLPLSSKPINDEDDYDTSRSHKIILNAGKADCFLQTRTSISGWLPLQQFPAYAAQVKPMHGAFFLFATIVIIGGTWACCKFGKKERRVDAGIPYQQLEMSTQTQPASVTANEITANTWDESWDDDWDDEEAVVRTIGKNSTENVSLNGISSRSVNANKDGWDIDWDD